jgi:diguanylate cyclase (GGDEF)-like protein
MIRGRRRVTGRGLQRPAAEERTPRLVLRFAVVTAVCLGIAAAAILVAIRHVNVEQAERSAAEQARLLAEAVLADGLRGSDLAAPVGSARRAELDELVGRRVLRPGTSIVRLRLVRADGVVTYSTDRAEIGKRTGEAARVAETVRAQEVRSGVSTVTLGGERVEVLRSFFPVAGAKSAGAAVVLQDHEPIEALAREAFLPVAGILEVVLILLYALLVPILARVSRRLVRQLDRIRHQAYHDDLTGLPNRRLLRERLEAALAEDPARPVAVLMLDLDRFKSVNDTFGHPGGDELLRRLAERLVGEAESDLLVARLGGDEFAVLAPGRTAREAIEVAREVRSIAGEPFTLDGVPLAVDASVGVALSPEDGVDADTLLRRADVAMFAAKGRRLGVARYDEGFDTSDREGLALMSQLRGGLERGEIVLHFQPKFDLRGDVLCGVEALVRWQHPAEGLIPPGAFVPYAEQSGLTRELTRRVLELAVEQAAAWRQAGTATPVAVNVTMFDLLDDGFADELATLLERWSLPAADLQLELTESAVMSEPERVQGMLRRVSALGVGLAVDDFGTGYSSLAHLGRLPVDTIKIDRSFVSTMIEDEGNRAIVAATIDLGHALGLRVVAEGIETAETAAELRALGCDIGQGYGLGQPVPADEVPLGARLDAAA